MRLILLQPQEKCFDIAARATIKFFSRRRCTENILSVFNDELIKAQRTFVQIPELPLNNFLYRDLIPTLYVSSNFYNHESCTRKPLWKVASPKSKQKRSKNRVVKEKSYCASSQEELQNYLFTEFSKDNSKHIVGVAWKMIIRIFSATTPDYFLSLDTSCQFVTIAGLQAKLINAQLDNLEDKQKVHDRDGTSVIDQDELKVRVTYDKESRKYTVEVKDKVCITCKYSYLLSSKFREKFFKANISDTLTKADINQLLSALLEVIASRQGDDTSLTIKSAFDNRSLGIKKTTYYDVLSSPLVAKAIGLYFCAIQQAVCIDNGCHLDESETLTQDAKLLRDLFKMLDLEDAILQDGASYNVASMISRTVDVRGSGNDKTAERYAGDAKRDAPRENTQLKAYICYSLTRRCTVSLSLTEGTATEHREISLEYIKKHPKQLLIADRGYHALITLLNLLHLDAKFIIRLNTKCGYFIQKATTEDGKELPELAGLKLNATKVAKAIEQYGCLDFLVIPAGTPEKSSLTQEELERYGIADSTANQPTIRSDKPLRVVAIHRNNDAMVDKDRIMYLGTSLWSDKASIWAIKQLYKTRWSVEIAIKALRQGCFLQRIKARNINTVKSCIYASFTVFAIKSNLYCRALGELGAELLEKHDVEDLSMLEDLEAIEKYTQAAQAGIPRRFMEIVNVICFFASRRHGRNSHGSCILEAIAYKDLEFKAYYDLKRVAVPQLSDKALEQLLDKTNSKFAFLDRRVMDMKTVIRAALEDDVEAMQELHQLEEGLHSIGFKSDIFGVLESLKARCNSKGLTIKEALIRPRMTPSLSLLCVMNDKRVFDTVASLFSANKEVTYPSSRLDGANEAKSAEKTLKKAVTRILDTCRTTSISLHSFERGSSYQITFRLLYLNVSKTWLKATSLQPKLNC